MKNNNTSRRRAAQLVASAALSMASAAQGAEPGDLFVRIDNDALTGTDREYTSGVQVGSTSATVESFDDTAFAPSLRWANDKLRWLQPKGFEENNVTWTIGQRMYTPENWRLREPDPSDRPYAGLLFTGLTYNGRDRNSMRSTSIDVGIVGPSALAEQAQHIVHDAIGANEFLGWDHQLNDEPVLRILHERSRRWDIKPARRFGDFTAHYGGSVGNLATFANAGAELRIGRSLPDNFGTATTLSYRQNTGPTHWGGSPSRPTIHGYVAVDARVVLQDITLDGNTWRDSASVERDAYVAELELGVALDWRGWQATLGATYRTKEYETQEREATFGTLTFRRALQRRAEESR
jgi:lipid A 3-O-deacylase